MTRNTNKTTTKKYAAYKDSGVEWLGEIPEGWKILPGLSFLFESKVKNYGMKRDTVLSLSYGKIRVKAKEELTGLVPESFETYQLVNQGDIIFRPTDLQNDKVSLRSAISNHQGIITSAYINIGIRRIAYPRFYHYFFRTIDNNKVIYGLGSGLRQNINFNDFRRFSFPFPPLEEQTAIADFLDEKTIKIDQAIAQKERMIALLQERKQIMIQQAVTKGLNPNVALKNSGVEWIGQIPEHWEVKRLASIGKFSKGGGFSKSDLTHSGFNAVLYGDIYTKYNFIIDVPVRFISEQTSQKATEILKGDLLFTGSGETKEDIGKCVCFSLKSKTFAGGDVIIFRQKKYDSIFLSFILNSHGVKSEKAKTAKGEIIVHTYASKLRNIYIPIPTIQEQVRIRNKIEMMLNQVNQAITLQQTQIQKLKEYKATLIDSAVTGKINVC